MEKAEQAGIRGWPGALFCYASDQPLVQLIGKKVPKDEKPQKVWIGLNSCGRNLHIQSFYMMITTGKTKKEILSSIQLNQPFEGEKSKANMFLL